MRTITLKVIIIMISPFSIILYGLIIYILYELLGRIRILVFRFKILGISFPRGILMGLRPSASAEHGVAVAESYSNSALEFS